MVDWKSPEEVAKDNLAFNRLIHVLFGVFVWEWIISLDFDWKFITRKKSFKWPIIFYFLNRYILLFGLIGMIIALNVTTPVDCKALWAFNQLFGGTAIGFASVNLSLRTIALWPRKWYIVYPIVALILGQFAVFLHGILLKGQYIQGQGCVIGDTNNKDLAARYIYTMAFDFLIMSLTAIKLLSPPSGNRSRVMQLIFHDGLIYFIIAFLSDLVATTFMLLNLNAPMSVIANVPAIVISTIVACRVVRRLSNFNTSHPEMFPSTSSSMGSGLAFLSYTTGARPNVSAKGTQKEGIHVQMETFRTPPSEKAVFPESDPRQLV